MSNTEPPAPLRRGYAESIAAQKLQSSASEIQEPSTDLHVVVSDEPLVEFKPIKPRVGSRLALAFESIKFVSWKERLFLMPKKNSALLTVAVGAVSGMLANAGMAFTGMQSILVAGVVCTLFIVFLAFGPQGIDDKTGKVITNSRVLADPRTARYAELMGAIEAHNYAVGALNDEIDDFNLDISTDPLIHEECAQTQKDEEYILRLMKSADRSLERRGALGTVLARDVVDDAQNRLEKIRSLKHRVEKRSNTRKLLAMREVEELSDKS